MWWDPCWTYIFMISSPCSSLDPCTTSRAIFRHIRLQGNPALRTEAITYLFFSKRSNASKGHVIECIMVVYMNNHASYWCRCPIYALSAQFSAFSRRNLMEPSLLPLGDWYAPKVRLPCVRDLRSNLTRFTPVSLTDKLSSISSCQRIV